jgi:integrase
VARTVLTPNQIGGIVQELEEPYATLVLFLATTGLRIGEAIAVKWSDFDGTLLTVSRRIYDGDVDTVKSIRSVRRLPVDSVLVERIQALRSRLANGEWVFCSEVGTPVNPGNALRRYLRPVATELGIALGGWHDFRHTLSTTLRKARVHPKVVSDILGHSKVNLAMDVFYDRTDTADFAAPLTAVANELLPNVTQNESAT